MAKYAGKQQAGSTPPAAATGPVTAKQIHSSMDKNRDGKISKEEASEDLRLFFADIDANGDGGIDVKEAEVMAKFANEQQPGAAKRTPAAERVTAKQLIESMDNNKDGTISKAEAPQEKTNFKYIDTNGDGAIDLNEAKVMANYVNQ